MCCDGTLFRFVKITGVERQELVKLGIGVGEKGGKVVMWLPCGKLEGKCCSVYGQRPTGCRAFVCALGTRLVAKEVTQDEARAHVVEMQQRLAALAAVLPPGEGPLLRRAREHIDSTTAQVTQAQLEAFQRVEDQRYTIFMPPPG